jgi:uridylate kinase
VESVCNRLAVGGELLAGEVAEDVEALEGDEQGLGEFEEDVFDLRVVQGGGNA